MSRDVLQEAARALRAEASGRSGAAGATRMRIVGSIRAERRRRVWAVRGSALLLAAALASTAWAAATGRLPALGVWTGLLGGEEHATGTEAPASSGGSARGGESATPVAAAPEESAPETPAVATPMEATPVEPTGPAKQEAARPVAGGSDRPARAVATSVSSAAPAPAPAASTEPAAAKTASPAASEAPSAAPEADAAADALYQRAHTLHFQAHDYAAARAAWEAYLKAAPRGRFAAFAHYNRALCLLRLGRTDEAKRALQPFASGAFGGYRRAEAQSLIDVIDARQP